MVARFCSFSSTTMCLDTVDEVSRYWNSMKIENEQGKDIYNFLFVNIELVVKFLLMIARDLYAFVMRR